MIGGLGSAAGAVLGALWVIGLPAFFPDNDLVPLLTSSIGLLVLLLYFPGGLVQIALRASATRSSAGPSGASGRRRRPSERRDRRRCSHGSARPPLPDGRPGARGRRASPCASVASSPSTTCRSRSGDGEIVGLIGTNGAGKSTLMNAIGGFVPVDGHGRAARRRRHGDRRRGPGPARASAARFQAAALFPELTVRETVLVALEARGRTGLPRRPRCSSRRSIRAERARRSEADELIDFLGLGRYADSRIADLSTGTRRIVELAGLLALDARVLCLDEPTAGVAQRETEAFGPLILEIRRELGAVDARHRARHAADHEHQRPRLLPRDRPGHRRGPPDDVRNDPAVIASYLGTDERAIARSGAAATHYHGRTLRVMRRTPLNDHWLVRPKVNRFAELFGALPEWEPATLPHDAMITGERSPSAGAASGYFVGGNWEYRRSLDVSDRATHR